VGSVVPRLSLYIFVSIVCRAVPSTAHSPCCCRCVVGVVGGVFREAVACQRRHRLEIEDATLQPCIAASL
jgi:hypothetical protein